MKKSWFVYLFAFVFFASISTCSVMEGRSQTTGFVFDTESLPRPKPEKKPFFWKISTETEMSNKFVSENGITLVNTPTFSQTVFFKTKRGKYDFGVETNLVVPTNQNPTKVFSILGVSAHRSFRQFDLLAKGKYFHSTYQSFATMGARVSKEISISEQVEFKPFTNLDWFVPTENNYGRVNAGLVWSNGLEIDARVRPFEFEFTNQLLADTGAIQAGRRLSINSDATCLLSVGALRFGPRIGYTHFLISNPKSIFARKSKVNFGFIVKIM